MEKTSRHAAWMECSKQPMPDCKLLRSAKQNRMVTWTQRACHKLSWLFHVRNRELVIPRVLCVFLPAYIKKHVLQNKLLGAVQNRPRVNSLIVDKNKLNVLADVDSEEPA